jgi:hypothetical protein
MLTCAVKAQGAEPLYVGVLEVVDQQDLHTREFHPFAQVRFAFRKDDQGWSPAGFAEPERMTWHLALDGREVGMVETRADTHSSEGGYTRYAQPITEPAKAPRIPVAEGRFWYHPWKVTVRPLLALSAPNAKDPDGWKPAQLGAVELQRLRAEFRKVVPGRRQCDQPETPPIRVARYGDGEIHLIAAYRARDGRVVAGEELTASKADCGFFDDEFSYSYWFLMQADGAATLMGSQMQPLEAADVDGDGVSEWLFHMSSGEQHDGYVLFHDRLTQKTEMGWGYH